MATRKTGNSGDRNHRCTFCGVPSELEPNLIAFQDEFICPKCLQEQKLLLESALDNIESIQAKTYKKMADDVRADKKKEEGLELSCHSEDPVPYGTGSSLWQLNSSPSSFFLSALTSSAIFLYVLAWMDSMLSSALSSRSFCS